MARVLNYQNVIAGFASKLAQNCVRWGLFFVGLDVIGDYLTEINVTSPTCIRELDSLYNIDISGQLMDVLEKYKQAH